MKLGIFTALFRDRPLAAVLHYLSFEHEDPVMSPEDGAEKAIEFLRPLLIKKPLNQPWW